MIWFLMMLQSRYLLGLPLSESLPGAAGPTFDLIHVVVGRSASSHHMGFWLAPEQIIGKKEREKKENSMSLTT